MSVHNEIVRSSLSSLPLLPFLTPSSHIHSISLPSFPPPQPQPPPSPLPPSSYSLHLLLLTLLFITNQIHDREPNLFICPLNPLQGVAVAADMGNLLCALPSLTGWLASLQGTPDPRLQALVLLLLLLLLLHLLNLLLLLNHLQPPLRQPHQHSLPCLLHPYLLPCFENNELKVLTSPEKIGQFEVTEGHSKAPRRPVEGAF